MKNSVVTHFVYFIITTLAWVLSLLILNNKNITLGKLNQNINQKISQEKYINQITDTIENNNMNFELINLSLPDNTNFQNFVSYIEDCANNNATEVVIDFESTSNNKSVSKTINQAKAGKNYVNLIIELNGSSSNVVKSLKEIEGGIYFVEFSKLNYISRSDDNSLATLKAQGKVYVDKQFKQ